jgi:hypothetical protein
MRALAVWPFATDIASHHFGSDRSNSGHAERAVQMTRLTDAVEKVGPLIGINALGIFDPAETGRRFGFTAA